MRQDNKRATIKVVLTKRADIFLVHWALCLIFCAMQTQIPVCSARCLAYWPSFFFFALLTNFYFYASRTLRLCVFVITQPALYSALATTKILCNVKRTRVCWDKYMIKQLVIYNWHIRDKNELYENEIYVSVIIIVTYVICLLNWNNYRLLYIFLYIQKIFFSKYTVF